MASDSRTETFAAAEVRTDSPRWSGAPFRVRAGKRMAKAAAEIVVEFKPAARVADPGYTGAPGHGGSVRFRLGRDDGVTTQLQAKRPAGIWSVSRCGYRSTMTTHSATVRTLTSGYSRT